jgi:hypothetical protein
VSAPMIIFLLVGQRTTGRNVRAIACGQHYCVEHALVHA